MTNTPASTDQLPEKKALSRREFLYIMLGLSVSASATVVCAGSVVALAPQFRMGMPSRLVNIPLERIAQIVDGQTASPIRWDDNVEPFSGKIWFWLSNTQDGLFALYSICTYKGCAYRWVGTNNRFECPCCGSKFKNTGEFINGPARRSLDKFAVRVTKNSGEIETSFDGIPFSLKDIRKVEVNLFQVIRGKSRT